VEREGVPTRVELSALWTVVMFNMAFADIVGFLHPGALQRILDGTVGLEPTPGLLLVFSVLIEVPIAMVFLSLVLSPAANRWLSTPAVILTAGFIVGGGSATSSYVLFAAVELAAMAGVLLIAWRGARTVAPVRRVSSQPSPSSGRRHVGGRTSNAFTASAPVPSPP